jgi:SHS family lactate transporter-like MFS transporter
MQNAKGFTSHDATIATIIGNCGAIVGGLLTGKSGTVVAIATGAR